MKTREIWIEGTFAGEMKVEDRVVGLMVDDEDDELEEDRDGQLPDEPWFDEDNDEDEIDEDDVFESPFEDDESDEFEVDTSVSLGDFFASSADDLDKITSEAKANEAKANADFDKFTQRVTTVGDY